MFLPIAPKHVRSAFLWTNGRDGSFGAEGWRKSKERKLRANGGCGAEGAEIRVGWEQWMRAM